MHPSEQEAVGVLGVSTHSSPVSEDTEKQEQGFGKWLNALQNHMIVPILCATEFAEVFSTSSCIIALPKIGHALSFSPSELQWVVAAYTLTFASLQLIGGHLSDIYYPKPVFIAGCTIAGVLSIFCAVSVNPIMLIIFRAVQGSTGAGFAIPPAISLIVQIRPNPAEQSLTLSAFFSSGKMGNALGFALDGVLTSYVGWKWVFYFVAIMMLSLAALSVLILPGHDAKTNMKNAGKKRRLDLPGVFALTGSLIIFVYAASDASSVGWDQSQIIVTLILSMLFFPFRAKSEGSCHAPEYLVHPEYHTFICLFTRVQFVEVFQHFSLLGPLWVVCTQSRRALYPDRCHERNIIVPRRGLWFVLIASDISPSGPASYEYKYWIHVFPGMVVGMAGVAISDVGVSVAVMASARRGEKGVVGALVNTSLQLGATIGLAVMTSVSTSVNDRLPTNAEVLAKFAGYSDAFWLLVGTNGLLDIVALVFVRVTKFSTNRIWHIMS
ncbi:major facilitator superfamily domain-containing protein [Phellopilus nigrolimitatus]|nr:major facilitator superfamily domain-containing protein [Phellopilus nigrolimitatus]